MAGDRSDFVRTATDVGEATGRCLAQAMRAQAVREASLVAAFTKPISEGSHGEWFTEGGHQKRCVFK
jgi:hypothetical protein